MLKTISRLSAAALVLVASVVAAFPDGPNPLINFQTQVNTKITPNGQNGITALGLNQVLSSIVPIFSSLGSWNSAGTFSLYPQTIPPCVGDTGNGGVSGGVPAPQAGDAASRKVLGARCSWIVPPPFVGDKGSGGIGGQVPAPQPGDTLAGKVLGAGGQWIIPPAPGRPDVKLWGAACDAQVLSTSITVTAGNGITRSLTTTGTNFSTFDVGKIINIGVGGGSAISGWSGTIASVQSATVITVTAQAGTAMPSATSTTIGYGTDDGAAINSALASGVPDMSISGQCMTSVPIVMTQSGAHFGGTISPNYHHDLGQPTPSAALVWAGACGVGAVLQQTSVPGASTQTTRTQYVHDLTIYAGTCASFGRQMTSVAYSMGERLSCWNAIVACFEYDTLASPAGEIAGNCYNTEIQLHTDNIKSNGAGLRLTGNIAQNTNTCLSTWINTIVFMNQGDGIQIVFGDHNYFTNTAFIVAAGTGAYSLHLTSGDASHYAQGNHFKGLSVGNVSTTSSGLIRSEAAAKGNSIYQMDNYNPPAGWHPSLVSGTGFNCQNDDWNAC